jgi:hypothetical protein
VTNGEGLIGISEEVGRRVLRRRKDELHISIEELAERCEAAGAPQLTVNALYVIEGGRRDRATGRRRRLVTVDEAVALAVALQLHPVDLLVPPELDDDEPYQLTPRVTTSAANARDWIAGRDLLQPPPRDVREIAKLIAAMPERRAAAIFGGDWRQMFDHDPRAHVMFSKVIAEEGGAHDAQDPAGDAEERP